MLSAGYANAAFTEAKSCDTCNFSEAQKIATLYYDRPMCHVSNLNGNNAEFGVTTYQCDNTSKDIIIANPLSKVAYKFNVSTQQQSIYSTALNINANNVALSAAESAALEEFYQIDSSFRQGVKDAGTVLSSHADFSSTLSNKSNSDFGLRHLATASNSEECVDHPSHYLTSEGAQRTVKQEMRAQISSRLGNQSWNDFSTDTDITGGGIQIGKDSFGISLSLQHNKVGIFATRSYGNPANKLVFAVSYYGEVKTGGARDLNLGFDLVQSASLVDGIEIGTFMSGTAVDLSTTAVSNCLIQNLESINGATIEQSSGSGGSTGSGPDGGSFGIPIIGGGGCTKTVRYTTCSTAHGSRTCTNNSVQLSC